MNRNNLIFIISVPIGNPGSKAGVFTLQEGELLIRYYLSKNNLAGAKSLFEQLVQTGAKGICIDVLAEKIKAAEKTNSLFMV